MLFNREIPLFNFKRKTHRKSAANTGRCGGEPRGFTHNVKCWTNECNRDYQAFCMPRFLTTVQWINISLNDEIPPRVLLSTRLREKRREAEVCVRRPLFASKMCALSHVLLWCHKGHWRAGENSQRPLRLPRCSLFLTRLQAKLNKSSLMKGR